ncbi:MAG: hypothetical protein GHCLOJNM_03649 [bacterium]|nr:hypothetical protein [bacterium]
MNALSSHRTILGLFGLAVLALAVRLHAGRESFWLDEMTAIEIAEKSIPHILRSLTVTQHAPALDYLILHLVSRLTDWDPAYWIPSLLWGLLAIPVGWLAVRAWFDEKVAWWTAFLLCLAFLPVRYSLEARMYSLWLLGTLGSLWALGAWRSKPSARRLVVWGVWALLVLYTHSFGLLVVALETSWLLLWSMQHTESGDAGRGRRVLPTLAALLAVSLLYLPQLLILLGRAEADSQVESPFRWSDLSYGLLWNELLEPLGPKPAIAGFLVPVAALAGLVRLMFQSSTLFFFSLSWLVVPTASILAVLATKETFFAPRYFIFACPVYLALAASGMERLFTRLDRSGKGAAARAIAAIALLVLVWPTQGPPKGDVWLPLVRPILENPNPCPMLVADNGRNAPYPRIETSFYLRNLPAQERPRLLPQDPELLNEVLETHPEIWLIETEDSRINPSVRRILSNRFELYHRVEGHSLYRAHAHKPEEKTPSPLENPGFQEEAAPIPARVPFGEDLTLLSYGIDPPTVKPGDWVTLSLFWECRRTPGFAGCIAARMDRFEHGAAASRLLLDHFPWGGLRRFTEWAPGERVLDRWTVRLPEDFPPGPTELSVKLERPARLGSHLRDLPFYEVENLSDSEGAPFTFQGVGAEVSPDGASRELLEGRVPPQVPAAIPFREGGSWVGARITEDHTVLVLWEGTDRRPPARHFEVSLGEPSSGHVIRLKLPYSALGRPPATLAPGERAAYTLPAKLPETFLGKKWVLILGTLDPRTGEKVESQLLGIPAELTGTGSARRE